MDFLLKFYLFNYVFIALGGATEEENHCFPQIGNALSGRMFLKGKEYIFQVEVELYDNNNNNNTSMCLVVIKSWVHPQA